MGMNDLKLEIVARNCQGLLLGELAAWLHDMGKCADAFLRPGGISFNASSCPDSPRVNPHKAVFSPEELQQLSYWSNLTPDRGQCARQEEAKHNTALWRTLNRLSLSVPSKNIALPALGDAPLQASFKEVILWGRPLVADARKYGSFVRILGDALAYFAAVLGRAHKSAHMEKEDKADGGTAPCITTPFGFTTIQIQGLDAKLSTVFSALGQGRRALKSEIRKQFSLAPGDTRRPINEVTLWDWSSIVAALYKAELARYVLTGERREAAQIAWRLLSVRTDGLGYLSSVSSIPDLLARKRLLEGALDRIQTLLEETYPLGLEVYRDEDGSIFVVPDIDVFNPNLKDTNSGKSLKDLITERFDLGDQNERNSLRGEVIPGLKVDENPWKGQPAPKEVPPVSEHLCKQRIIKSDIRTVSEAWGERVADICTVCGLRPQGSGGKAASRNVCDICEGRRADRAKEWATQRLHTTIWTNEVADTNARLALVVGRFDLTHWLSGDLVRTLAVREPNDENGRDADKVAKNPSFARLRRIWETTRRFWQEVCPTDKRESAAQSLIGATIGEKGHRLALKGSGIPVPGPYHTYEMVLPKGVRLSVVWDESGKRFITADNLEYLSGKTQLNEDIHKILKADSSFVIEEPAGYGEKNKVLGTLILSEDAKELPGGTYVPAIPILAEPRTFMALVPADKALDVLRAIKAEYEREMGKVRNRLSLHLGIVFAHRRTPLRALLDAGRQMLNQEGKCRGWKVICRERKETEREEALPKRFQAERRGQFKEWYEVTLERNGRRICWYVPGMMGDGQIEDKWYSYVFLEADAEPVDRASRYRTRNPWTDTDGWLVRAAELRLDDRIYFAPSTFDFEYLDTTARRFEIHYDQTGRRTTRRTKPYYLEDLERLEILWSYMKRLTKTQRQQVVRTIEATREAWYGQDADGQSTTDEVFKQFVADALAGAAWPQGQPWRSIPQEWRDKLIQAGLLGELTDLAELHMEILKE